MMSSLMAVLGLDVSPFKRNLLGAQADARIAGKEMAASFGEVIASKLGLLGGAAGFGALVESTLQTTERIRQLSQEFRISTDTVQMWDRAAQKVGMTAEDIGNAMNRLKKAREAAITKDDVGGFGKFGIGMEEIKNQALSTEEIMSRMRAAASGHPITDQEDVAGMELMGKSGAKILSAMNELANLGPIPLIKKEDIDKLHEADEALKNIKREIQVGLAMELGKIPGIIDRIAAGAVGFGEFMFNAKSWNQARRNLSGDKEGEVVPAPLFDLKGRPIAQHEKAIADAKAEGDANVYSVTKTVNLHKDLAETEKLREQLARKIFENDLKGMSVAERRATLEQEMAEHKRKAIEFEFGEGDDKKATEEKLEAERIRGELLGLKDKKSSSGGYQAPQVSDRQRIGAYVSPMETNMANVAQKSEGHLAAILSTLREHGKLLGRTKY